MGALWQKESGMQPGILGQSTPYGVPVGIGQMLPGTAEGVAAANHIAWRPDLYGGNSQDAANYQKTLSEYYLLQGYKATGNMRDAFRYYYGGPNRSLWGPKTNAYADGLMAKVRGVI